MAKKTGRITKWIAGIAVIALVCGGGYAAFHYRAKSKATTANAQSFVTIARGNVEQTVTAQGKLEPKNYVDVGAQVSGQLNRLHVDIGDTVKKDALIAEIDPEIYETQVEADMARLKTLSSQRAVQEAQVRQAQQKFDRNERLIKSKAISNEAFQDAETALLIAKAELDALDSQIEEANSTLEGNKANLNYTRIFAPMDGTVVSVTAKEGETLNANQTTPTIVQLADLNTMTARAQVAEADITKLKTGMPVYFTTMGAQNRQWNGTVRQILPTPETINDVVLYNVLVDADNTDRQLMSGMTTQMFFILEKAENVPVIPTKALLKRDREAGKAAKDAAGDAYIVKTLKNGAITEQTVFVGATDRIAAQILSGLSEGDQVVIPTPAGESAQGEGGAGQNARTGGRRMTPRL